MTWFALQEGACFPTSPGSLLHQCVGWGGGAVGVGLNVGLGVGLVVGGGCGCVFNESNL